MNRDQKAAFVENVAERVQQSEAIFAVDYRGISVPQAAELRSKLGESGASFQVVKNTLTRLALDKADSAGKTGTIDLKEFLEGPTAFTYVKGDVAVAAKAIADFTKEYELLEYKGGMMDGQVVTIDQFKALTKLPSRDVLNGQLVALVATPITGVVRTLNALVSGLAIQLAKIADQRIASGEAKPAPEETSEPTETATSAPADEPEADVAPAEEPSEPTETATSAPADEPAPEEAPEAESASPEAPSTEPAVAPATDEPLVDADESSQPEPAADAEATPDSSDSARASDADGAPSPDGEGSSSNAAPDSDEPDDAPSSDD